MNSLVDTYLKNNIYNIALKLFLPKFYYRNDSLLLKLIEMVLIFHF